MNLSLTVPSIEHIDRVSNAIIPLLDEHPIVCFHGELGAGKTTVIKSICAALGVQDSLSSPSFSIVNEYQDAHGETIFHLDLYRLKKPEELLDIGWEDYLLLERPMFIEWPEYGEPYIPKDALHVRIDVEEHSGLRNITLTDQE